MGRGRARAARRMRAVPRWLPSLPEITDMTMRLDSVSRRATAPAAGCAAPCCSRSRWRWAVARIPTRRPRRARSAASASLETAVVAAATVPRETLFDGVVEAVNQSTVSAQTSGRVLEMPVDVGDQVEKGALIVRFTDTEQKARGAAAESELSEANARLAEAQLGVRPHSRDLCEEAGRQGAVRPCPRGSRRGARPRQGGPGRARRSARRARQHRDPRPLCRHRGGAPRADRRNGGRGHAAAHRRVARAPARARRRAAPAHRRAAQAPPGPRAAAR